MEYVRHVEIVFFLPYCILQLQQSAIKLYGIVKKTINYYYPDHDDGFAGVHALYPGNSTASIRLIKVANFLYYASSSQAISHDELTLLENVVQEIIMDLVSYN